MAYQMTEATRQRAIALQETSAYWYARAHVHADRAEMLSKGNWSYGQSTDYLQALDAQEFAARAAQSARAILCDA